MVSTSFKSYAGQGLKGLGLLSPPPPEFSLDCLALLPWEIFSFRMKLSMQPGYSEATTASGNSRR